MTTLFNTFFRIETMAFVLSGLAFFASRFQRHPIERIRLVQGTFAAIALATGLFLLPSMPKWKVPVFRAEHAAEESGDDFTAISQSTDIIVQNYCRHEEVHENPTHFSQDFQGGRTNRTEFDNAAPIDEPPNDFVSKTSPSAGIFDFRPAILGLLAVGSLFFLVQGIAGIVRLRKILAASTPCNPIDGKSVRLRMSKEIRSPLVCGLFRPTIVVPDGMAGAELRYAVAHEQAHLRQGDLATWQLLNMFAPLLWMQPFYWLLLRRLRIDQDFLADAEAVRTTGGPEDYAELLLSLARNRAPFPLPIALGMGDRPSLLRRRIEMLLSGKQPMKTTCRPAVFWGMVVLFAAVAPLLGILLRIEFVEKTVAQTPNSNKNEEVEVLTMDGKSVSGMVVRLAQDDILVFESGQWKNKKSGEIIPPGTAVEGTRGWFRLDSDGEHGMVVKLSGEGATGGGKHVEFSNGGNAISVSVLSPEEIKNIIAMDEKDAFVYDNGIWKNEKNGNEIESGALVAGTRGVFRLENKDGIGSVVLINGFGAVGSGKYIRWSNGGNGFSGGKATKSEPKTSSATSPPVSKILLKSSDRPDVRVYAVGKQVKDFPKNEDDSTPETAVASKIREGAQKYPKQIAEADQPEWTEEKRKRNLKMAEEVAKSQWTSEILEVRVFKEKHAMALVFNDYWKYKPFTLWPMKKVGNTWSLLPLERLETYEMFAAKFAEAIPRWEREDSGQWVSPDGNQSTHLMVLAPQGDFKPRFMVEINYKLRPLWARANDFSMVHMKTWPEADDNGQKTLVVGFLVNDPEAVREIVEKELPDLFVQRVETLNDKIYKDYKAGKSRNINGQISWEDATQNTHMIVFTGKDDFKPKTSNEILLPVSQGMRKMPVTGKPLAAGWTKSWVEDGRLVGALLTNDPERLEKMISDLPGHQLLRTEELTEESLKEYQKRVSTGLPPEASP